MDTKGLPEASSYQFFTNQVLGIPAPSPGPPTFPGTLDLRQHPGPLLPAHQEEDTQDGSHLPGSRDRPQAEPQRLL